MISKVLSGFMVIYEGNSFVVACALAAWPSIIDDFVEYAKARLDS
jgi:hypothetical protein